MVELNGKYNTAKVYTDNIDDETISQVVALLNQESIKDNKIRIMPDCHAGAGCVIGTTMTLHDSVIPNLVGCDIGCGMHVAKISDKNINFEKLDNIIREYVPSGFEIHDKAIASSHVEDIACTVDVEKALKSLGTLGGGNHFIEIDIDIENNLYLVIHTGSRHLGIEVCDYYQKLACKTLKAKSLGGSLEQKVKEYVAEMKSSGREREISSGIEEIKKNFNSAKISIPDALAYIDAENFSNYIHDMKLAQQHAAINRQTIADTILEHMELHEVERFDTIHNYIDTDNMILRKGSVSAQAGEKLIIPMNMRDGSLICVGKGNEDWNYSAPHGAGRVMSRSKAKESVSMEEYKESMDGIYTTCVNSSTIDESPMAYKPMQEIIDNIHETVDIVNVIKPVYNFKASEV